MAAEPIGHFPKNLVDDLAQAYGMVALNIESSTSSASSTSIRADQHVRSYQSRVNFLLSHLSGKVAAFSESLMIWTICQRIVLELDARITWLRDVESIWNQTSVSKIVETRNVIGALTDSPEHAEHLFRVSSSFKLYSFMTDLLLCSLRLVFPSFSIVLSQLTLISKLSNGIAKTVLSQV